VHTLSLKLLDRSLYGNSTATYDLRTGVQADASTEMPPNRRQKGVFMAPFVKSGVDDRHNHVIHIANPILIEERTALGQAI
jgi:hypothetical protein